MTPSSAVLALCLATLAISALALSYGSYHSTIERILAPFWEVFVLRKLLTRALPVTPAISFPRTSSICHDYYYYFHPNFHLLCLIELQTRARVLRRCRLRRATATISLYSRMPCVHRLYSFFSVYSLSFFVGHVHDMSRTQAVSDGGRIYKVSVCGNTIQYTSYNMKIAINEF